MPPPINYVHDLLDPNDPQGRSYREVNLSKTHRYPIGALVEFNHGVRLWVVHHARDCDGTPLYCLAVDPRDTEIEREGFYNPKWVTGLSEQWLTFVRMINAPETDRKIEIIQASFLNNGWWFYCRMQLETGFIFGLTFRTDLGQPIINLEGIADAGLTLTETVTALTMAREAFLSAWKSKS